MAGAATSLSPTVAGRRAGEGWQVWVAGPDANLTLSVAQARRLAAELVDMCDVIDGVHPSLDGERAA